MLEQISSVPATTALHQLDLPPHLYSHALVPLIGLLLDYSVSYCLSSTADSVDNCLGGRQLTLFKVNIQEASRLYVTAAYVDAHGDVCSSSSLLCWSSPGKLAFTCPSDLLGCDGVPTVADLRNNLIATFQSRLDDSDSSHSTNQTLSTLTVTVDVTAGIVLDQVAL